ncbi:MAG TPA: hypothetical protein VNZ64_12180 [Candidatus Acidoferrum sp.]|jgi:hypothetical protein|nr:hypothetical protein [Candidatus Acidoferrum sp.]
MIGVISRSTEIEAVEEFFQLFKTPWEFFREGQVYDVLIATTDQIPEIGVKTILSYGSEIKSSDRGAKVKTSSTWHGAKLDFRGTQIPIYGDLLGFEAGGSGVLGVVGKSEFSGLQLNSAGVTIFRFGYDLFAEVGRLLKTGQPIEHARTPTLELHIAIMRDSILSSGIELIEIPAVPAGYEFTVCLTHDIDFVGIRLHFFDHSMWGFLYRSTVGAVREFGRGRISLGRLVRMWRAAGSLPFVYLGWMKDFWLPFEWYLKIEEGLSPTYFLIPFKHRAGDKVLGRHANRRATAYDVTDLRDWTARLLEEGCELGVHGIDAWHDVEKARSELERVAGVTGRRDMGIRVHWLLHDDTTYRVMEEAGYSYDSTAGYNETIGYRCGTTQPFRPLGARELLELPLHIQDGALFFPERLGLPESEAWQLCREIVANAKHFGGVVTVLWHDRSPGPERFWGEFYARLVQELKSMAVWFASGGRTVSWFRARREVVFERVGATVRAKRCSGEMMGLPPLTLRVHRPDSSLTRTAGRAAGSAQAVDICWTGGTEIALDALLGGVPRPQTADICPLTTGCDL